LAQSSISNLHSILFAQQVSQDKWTAKVYPNPSVRHSNIELTGEFDEYMHVNIVDETGKRVYVNNTLNDRIHAINLSTIPKGVYTIQIMSTNVYKNRCLFYNKSSLQTKIQSGL
tara:strand:+ start:2500 stop:2841 length:342 start_codon:yes stop_codon:yes gene_type:complete